MSMECVIHGILSSGEGSLVPQSRGWGAEEEKGQEEKASVPVLGKPFLPEEQLISEALL